MNTPLSMPQAIAEIESYVADIRKNDADFEVDSFVCGEEDILNELVSFMAGYPEVEIEKQRIEELSGSGGGFWAVCMKSKKLLTGFAVALAAFCRLRKCRITIKSRGQSISAEAPTAEEIERILRTVDRLFIHPKGKC